MNAYVDPWDSAPAHLMRLWNMRCRRYEDAIKRETTAASKYRLAGVEGPSHRVFMRRITRFTADMRRAARDRRDAHSRLAPLREEINAAVAHLQPARARGALWQPGA